MNTLSSLIKRNMLMYLKNRMAVFFSLLSVMTILGLYIIFLANININTVQSLINANRQAIAYLVNSWVMAGIIIVNSVTVTLSVLGIMIDDETNNHMASFLVSPVSRLKLTLGYISSSFIIGTIMCILTLVLSQVYIVSSGGNFLTIYQILRVLGLIIISVFSSTCFVFFLVSLVRTSGSFSALSIIVGSFVGFAAGIYIPVGELPNTVQTAIKYIPIFYDTSLMQSVYTETPVSKVFAGTSPDIVSEYLHKTGIMINWGGNIVSDLSKIAIITISGTIFIILSVLLMRKRRMVSM
ncbi:MAG: ABC transporter permease [Bacillota bacterium]|nr:ABC transporter permease [Bacillota bacterium]